MNRILRVLCVLQVLIFCGSTVLASMSKADTNARLKARQMMEDKSPRSRQRQRSLSSGNEQKGAASSKDAASEERPSESAGKAEEKPTITVQALDKSKATVALAWLLPLQFNHEASFDGMHENETEVKSSSSTCLYDRVGECTMRVAGCLVCNAVAQSWFEDIATKDQLNAIVNALRVVYTYTQNQKQSPRGIAKSFVLSGYSEADLKVLWTVATRLGLYPYATAIVMQLRARLKDVPTDKDARAKFDQEHPLAQPIIDQMLFEQVYAAVKTKTSKVPDLPIGTLCAYSFFPVTVKLPTNVEQVFASIKDHALINRILSEIPVGKVQAALWQLYASRFAKQYAQSVDFITQYQKLPEGRYAGSLRQLALEEMMKAADAMVINESFDQAVFEKLPEGYFKILVRKFYWIKKKGLIDALPIQDVVLSLDRAAKYADGSLWLNALGLTDVSWLRDELYLLSELQDVTDITLRSNKLTALPANLFDFAPALRKLDLAGNDLATLPEGIFSNCKQLEELDLSHNALRWLSEVLLDTCTQLKKLNLKQQTAWTTRPDALIKALRARKPSVKVYIEEPAAH